MGLFGEIFDVVEDVGKAYVNVQTGGLSEKLVFKDAEKAAEKAAKAAENARLANIAAAAAAAKAGRAPPRIPGQKPTGTARTVLTSGQVAARRRLYYTNAAQRKRTLLIAGAGAALVIAYFMLR